MTSLLCVRELGGIIQTHHGDLVEQLIIDANDHIHATLTRRNERQRNFSPDRPRSTPNPSLRGGKTVHPDSLIVHTLRLQDWLSNKSVKHVQEKSDLEGKKTKKLYDRVLQTEDTFVKDVNELISYQQLLEYRKKEILHKKWSDEVYEPVRHEVVKEINSPAYIQLDRRKRELHKDYLRHTNKKGHVFLDTIDTNEYNPLGLHDNRPHIVKGMQAEVRPLNDPLLSQERDRANEERTILRCITGINFTDKDIHQIRLPPVPLVPLGRHGTDSRTWLEMPMADIESPVRQASRRRMKEASNGSQIDFSRWSSSPLTRTLVDEELQSRNARMYVLHPPYTLGQSQTLIESPAKNSLIAQNRPFNAVHACST